MNILLIRPYWPYPYNSGENTYNRIWPPLSLANSAAILEKNGHRVQILDAHAMRLKPKKIAPFLEGFDKIFITSSSLDRWICPNIEISSFLETVHFIKKQTDDFYVIGFHGTKNPQKIINLTKAKAIIRGEPEYTILDICQDKLLHEISGVSFMDKNSFISTPDRTPFDMKNLPIPAYHLLKQYNYDYEILGGDFSLFEISRGCQYNCRFCSKIMFGSGLRTKTKNQIIQELKTAIEDHKIKNGYFIDLEFLSNKTLVYDLCDFLTEKKYDFQWCCQTRPDSIDKEILEKMKEAGCSLIHMGVESGAQKILNFSRKQLALSQIENAFQLCKTLNIETLAFFLFGFKDETPADREESFIFAKKLDPDYVSFHKIFPYFEDDIYLSTLDSDKNIDKFIRKKYLQFYLNFKYFRKLNLSRFLKTIKLFWGRYISQ